MNQANIVAELEKQYPGKQIVCIPEEVPQEIVCEFEPTSDHPAWSNVIAVVGKSEPHFHKVSTEWYKVVKGTLCIYVDGKKHTLKEGDEIVIKPGPVHYAESANQDEDCWFLTRSEPGWTEDDHILVNNEL